MTPAFEADLEVLTELGAAGQFTVEALVDETVEFIRSISTVVFMVTQQRLIHTVTIGAGEGCVVTFLFFSSAVWILGGLVRVIVTVEVSITLP